MEGLYLYGNDGHKSDWISKFESNPQGTWLNIDQDLPEDATCVFDFVLDTHPERLASYMPQADLIVVGSAVLCSLGEMASSLNEPLQCMLAGINAWPGMLTNPAWELSAFNDKSKERLESLLKKWELDYGFVNDRVGMATPRLLSMIINEASFTVQEGTASEVDIDQAMKLGVNYPGGPFTWLAKFGHANVVGLLEKMQAETGNPRYKIAPYLKQQMRKKHAEAML